VSLQPGESRVVTFHLDRRSLWFWNADMKRLVEPGDFDIMTGANSADLKTAMLHVEG
jgi:beta-glucosidase